MDIAVVGNRVNSQYLELKHGYSCWVGLFPSCGGKPKAQTFKAP